MRQMFSYKKFDNDEANLLVEAFSELVNRSANGDTMAKADYKEANKLYSENMIKYCAEKAGLEFTGIDMVKNPMISEVNVTFKNVFATILAQAITPVVPTVVSENYNQLYDVHQVGFGDNAKFEVDSNELYIVNDMAEGIKRGAQSTLYNREFTINTSRKQISTFVDWYHIASGVMDWGKFGVKIGASYAAYIQGLTTKAMAQVIIDAASHGISGYQANGFNDTNWVTLYEKVKYANGGVPVYGLGTRVAISKVLPANTSFRFGPESDIVTKGFLPAYMDVPLVELGNALVPNTINSNPTTVVGNDFIYMIAMGSHKPCKVVIEGNNVVVQEDALTQKDHCFNLTVDMRIGAGAVVGSKFGYLKLN